MLRSHFLKFLTVLFSLLSGFCSAESKPHILVSVASYKFFVEKIAGDTVKVGLMVPAGASAHTFEPTPKQMLEASRSNIWFTIGESFETRAIKALTSYNQEMLVVDLRQGVDMIISDPFTGCCCHPSCQDLHIWLSPKQAKIQARTIGRVLSERFPQHAERYKKGLEDFLSELDALDQQIALLMQPLKQRTIMVSHPAYAYFCRDYNLSQLSIECEGKDPTPQQLNKILNKARGLNIKRIYIQPQYSNKGALLFARELGAEVVTLDPYSEQYLKIMMEIAKQFASQP